MRAIQCFSFTCVVKYQSKHTFNGVSQEYSSAESPSKQTKSRGKYSFKELEV